MKLKVYVRNITDDKIIEPVKGFVIHKLICDYDIDGYTLCETCHSGYHNGTVELPESITKRGASFKDATFMGIMRWAFYDRLKELYPNIHMTYGYITKHTRINHNLEKAHHIDERCISGNPDAVSDGTVYYQKKVRCHNRQIHKMSIDKGSYRKLNQASYEVKGFRLFDKVRFNGQEGFIFGRRSTGRMDVRLLDGARINASAGYKKLVLLEKPKYILTERRTAVPLTGKPVGFSA